MAVATGRVTSQVLLASVLPCGYFKDVGACLQLAAGALQVSGDLPGGNRRTSPLLLIGGRLVYEHLFLPWLGLHAHLTVSGVPLRTTVVAGGAVVWVTSLVSSELAAGAVVRF
ncbi:MAG: hypothetical protein IPJ65_18385 [Archangiaceae bacterium]|nr:hypothetical protein [Archangiaceae bacterium]